MRGCACAGAPCADAQVSMLSARGAHFIFPAWNQPTEGLVSQRHGESIEKAQTGALSQNPSIGIPLGVTLCGGIHKPPSISLYSEACVLHRCVTSTCQ